jgi:DNA modification methylase
MMFHADKYVTIHNGDCRHMAEIPDGTVQCVVTSPPYWGLRKYAGDNDSVWGGDPDCEHEWGNVTRSVQNNSGLQGSTLTSGAGPEKRQAWHDGKSGSVVTGTCSKCGAWWGSYGLEPTPELYVQHTVEILREVWRVLRDDGVVFWNIGDSYAGGGPHHGDKNTGKSGTNQGSKTGVDRNVHGLKPKDLVLIPFRVALAAQADGWWVRSDIIWSKPNPMPESVTDRPTSAHEHIFMLTKQARYYYDADAVREANVRDWSGEKGLMGMNSWAEDAGRNDCNRTKDPQYNPAGRNIRNVWTFATQPYPAAHFATFPEKLPETCIKAATRAGDIVLDPFAGSGTTIHVARSLGRRVIGYEISEEYCELILDRVRQMSLL